MRVPTLSPIRMAAGVAAALLLVIACTDQPTQPTPDPEFAKGGGGGGGGPSVKEADPPWAEQDTTIDVRVIGSGFDDGSVVKFLQGGQSTPKIVTNSSTFIDKNTIIANVTIAVDAEVTLYDIEVTTRRGKKGIGSELFSVVEKGTGPPDKTGDLGTWDGTQEILYVESFEQSDINGDRLVVTNSDGSNRAIVYILVGGSLFNAHAALSPDGNSIVFGIPNEVYIIRRDPVNETGLPPEFLFQTYPGGTQNIPQQAVSPDGTKIAYIRPVYPSQLGCSPPDSLSSYNVNHDLFVHDLNTGTSTKITTHNTCPYSNPRFSARGPTWASNTEVAVIQRASGALESDTSYIAVFDIGTLVDADGDGVIDNLVEKWSTANGGNPDAGNSLWYSLEWAPDADRLVVVSPWDLWLVEFSDTSIQSCNLTTEIGSVHRAGFGSQNRIVFSQVLGKRGEYSISTGTIGASCPTTLQPDGPALFVELKTGQDHTEPKSPTWRR